MMTPTERQSRSKSLATCSMVCHPDRDMSPLGSGLPTSLLVQAQWALSKNQRTLGEMLGVSRRTVVRWTRGGGTTLPPSRLLTLARALHSVDAALAEKIALGHGQTLAGLGIAVQAPEVDVGADARLAEVVVCAAADALDAPPRAVRPALLAALESARQVGLSAESLEKALRARVAPSPPRSKGKADRKRA